LSFDIIVELTLKQAAIQVLSGWASAKRLSLLLRRELGLRQTCHREAGLARDRRRSA
jgi:hypothetical protein